MPKGRVVGHDNGSSVLFNGYSYWFFADTLLDKFSVGNGGLDYGDGDPQTGDFIGASTVASTDNLTLNDCELTDYALQPNVSPERPAKLFSQVDDQLAWAQGSVVANGNVYVFGVDQQDLETSTATFLAKFDPLTKTTTRIFTWKVADEGPIVFTSPTLVKHSGSGAVEYVYIVGPGPKDGNDIVRFYLARVKASEIEDKSKYHYWSSSSGWNGTSRANATQIFQEVGAGSGVSMGFRPELNRFLVTYECGYGVDICGRTAKTEGATQDALDDGAAGWDATGEQVTLLHCPGGDGFRCYAPYQHPEYSSSRLVLSVARLTPFVPCPTGSDSQCNCSGSVPTYTCELESLGYLCKLPNVVRRYEISLYEFSLLPITRPFRPFAVAQPAFFYTPKNHCEQPNSVPLVGAPSSTTWRVSYQQQLSTGQLAPMSFNSSNNWHGSTDTDGTFPLIQETTSLPSTNTAAVRVLVPPTVNGGRFRILGEIRKKFSCGDDVGVSIVKIRNGAILPGVPVYEGVLSPATRTKRIVRNARLLPGDSLGFVVRRAGAGPQCDNVNFTPTIWMKP